MTSPTPARVDQFCQHVERRLRCVSGAGHSGSHDLQPFSSASVRAIVRQEAQDVRLGGTPARVVEAIDRAQEQASEDASQGKTGDETKDKGQEAPAAPPSASGSPSEPSDAAQSGSGAPEPVGTS